MRISYDYSGKQDPLYKRLELIWGERSSWWPEYQFSEHAPSPEVDYFKLSCSLYLVGSGLYYINQLNLYEISMYWI